MKSILKGLVVEFEDALNDYFVNKINEIMQMSGGFIYEFLELVISYNNLFKNHIQRMEQGLLKVPENMKDITQKVSHFRENFTKDWKVK
jgi:hypothetical protein